MTTNTMTFLRMVGFREMEHVCWGWGENREESDIQMYLLPNYRICLDLGSSTCPAGWHIPKISKYEREFPRATDSRTFTRSIFKLEIMLTASFRKIITILCFSFLEFHTKSD